MSNPVKNVQTPVVNKIGFHVVAMTVGCVLCTSKNTGVKALGAGIAMAAFLKMCNYIAIWAEK